MAEKIAPRRANDGLLCSKIEYTSRKFVILNMRACFLREIMIIISQWSAWPDSSGRAPAPFIFNRESVMDNVEKTDNVTPAPSSETQDRLKAARDYACAQYDKLRRATAEQMEVVRKYTAEQMGNVRKYTDEAREQINAGWDVTCAKAKDLHAAGEEYVKANPTGSVLGALGVGIILGLLLGSGRR